MKKAAVLASTLALAGVGAGSAEACASDLAFLTSSPMKGYTRHSKESMAAVDAEIWGIAAYNAKLAEYDARSLPIACSPRYRDWKSLLINSASHYYKGVMARKTGNYSSAIFHLKRSVYYLKLITSRYGG
jgi:hypothetical protein